MLNSIARPYEWRSTVRRLVEQKEATVGPPAGLSAGLPAGLPADRPLALPEILRISANGPHERRLPYVFCARLAPASQGNMMRRNESSS